MTPNMKQRMMEAGWKCNERTTKYKMLGGHCLEYLLDNYQFKTVLDIGSGEGFASKALRIAGKTVTGIDHASAFADKVDIHGDYLTHEFDNKFDCIWCSHVLEHIDNPYEFCCKLYHDLRLGGILAITVPPLHHQVVAGHFSLWNTGLLMYVLARAGFDCRYAHSEVSGYNVSIIVQKCSEQNNGEPLERLPFEWGADGRIGEE